MMRIRSILFAALAVMCMGAITASAASAAEFEQTAIESEKSPHKLTGKKQKLTAEGLEGSKVVITCEKVKGTVKFSKTELTAPHLEYEECNVAGKAAEVKTDCTVGVTNGGLVNIGKGEGVKTCFTITTNDKSCKIIIKGEQLNKKLVTFKNNGGNLIIEAAVVGIAFESATGKACTFKNENVDGTAGYSGTLEVTGINIK